MKQMERQGKQYTLRYKKIGIWLVLSLMILFAALSAISKISEWFPPSGNEAVEFYLIAGADESVPSETDMMFLTTINRKKKEMQVMALPRDTLILTKDKEPALLKHAYGNGGAESLKNAVENLLHIRVDKYAVIRYGEFTDMVNRMGGISFFVEMTMDHSHADGTKDFYIRRGYQPLDGGDVLSYLRYADGKTGEIGRIQREERLAKSLLRELQKNMSFFNLYAGRTYWNASDTDITSEEMGDFLCEITDFPAENCRFTILPGEIKTNEKGETFWAANPVNVQKSIADSI